MVHSIHNTPNPWGHSLGNVNIQASLLAVFCSLFVVLFDHGPRGWRLKDEPPSFKKMRNEKYKRLNHDQTVSRNEWKLNEPSTAQINRKIKRKAKQFSNTVHSVSALREHASVSQNALAGLLTSISHKSLPSSEEQSITGENKFASTK